MTLFDILSFGQRIVIYCRQEDDVIYTWNQSITLQRWQFSRGSWTETDIRTLQSASTKHDGTTFEKARASAVAWDNE